MNNIACPICKRSDSRTLFKISQTGDKVYLIKNCNNCGSTYTHFDHEINITELYDGKDYTVKDTRNSIFFRIQKLEYGLVIRKIKNIVDEISPSILDFGSGKGLFLHFANLQGCNVKGIESSKPRADYARKYFGLDINSEYFTTGTVFKTKFDVLTIFHVLEHLQNPGELLRNLIKSNLKFGGLLIAEVPNFGSWQSKWAGNKWLHLDVPRHLSHFTDESLARVIKEPGFTIIKKEYFSIHLGIVGMVQSIFSWFGYNKFLIAELKENKDWLLILKVLLTLPFAILLESLAALFKKGGIIRYYAIYEPYNEENDGLINPDFKR